MEIIKYLDKKIMDFIEYYGEKPEYLIIPKEWMDLIGKEFKTYCSEEYLLSRKIRGLTILYSRKVKDMEVF